MESCTSATFRIQYACIPPTRCTCVLSQTHELRCTGNLFSFQLPQPSPNVITAAFGVRVCSSRACSGYPQMRTLERSASHTSFPAVGIKVLSCLYLRVQFSCQSVSGYVYAVRVLRRQPKKISGFPTSLPIHGRTFFALRVYVRAGK